jgi:hypothetical protein
MSKVTNKYSDKSPMRIWPHHFDDGLLINLKRDDEGVTSLVSMGLAMPDKYYNQPYFYVNAWSKEGINYSKLPPLKSKGEWHVDEWYGQVLKAEDFACYTNSSEQEETCRQFLEEAISNAVKMSQ